MKRSFFKEPNQEDKENKKPLAINTPHSSNAPESLLEKRPFSSSSEASNKKKKALSSYGLSLRNAQENLIYTFQDDDSTKEDSLNYYITKGNQESTPQEIHFCLSHIFRNRFRYIETPASPQFINFRATNIQSLTPNINNNLEENDEDSSSIKLSFDEEGFTSEEDTITNKESTTLESQSTNIDHYLTGLNNQVNPYDGLFTPIDEIEEVYSTRPNHLLNPYSHLFTQFDDIEELLSTNTNEVDDSHKEYSLTEVEDVNDEITSLNTKESTTLESQSTNIDHSPTNLNNQVNPYDRLFTPIDEIEELLSTNTNEVDDSHEEYSLTEVEYINDEITSPNTTTSVRTDNIEIENDSPFLNLYNTLPLIHFPIIHNSENTGLPDRNPNLTTLDNVQYFTPPVELPFVHFLGDMHSY
jgi:hypothetical protein